MSGGDVQDCVRVDPAVHRVAVAQSDPLLEGVAGVCFDEFHERSTDGDLCLALCREVQVQALPQLRLLQTSWMTMPKSPPLIRWSR
jgi:hypothetical protein